MYTTFNYQTKKALKEAVASGLPVTVYQPNNGVFGPWNEEPTEGTVYLEGPHYPKPHMWYAQGTLKDGVLVKVK